MKRGLLLGILAGVGYAIWRENQREHNAVSLRNKVVILTGAAAGIGRSTAHAFAREQAHLLLVDKDAQGLSTIQEAVQQYGVHAATLSIDLTDENAPAEIVAYALEKYGRIDALVNNAGVVISGDMTLHSQEAIKRLFNINVIALIRLTQAVVPVMKRQHSGHIVNVASCAATMPSAGYVVYGASKGAVMTFSHALRREVEADGVRVSYIAPGFINTQMIVHMSEDGMKEAGMISSLTSVGVLEPHHVAEGILQAIQFNDYEVIVGQSGYHLSSWLHRLSPRLLDWVFARFTQREAILETSHRPE
jgi:short-subunit dehydrogenase